MVKWLERSFADQESLGSIVALTLCFLSLGERLQFWDNKTKKILAIPSVWNKT